MPTPARLNVYRKFKNPSILTPAEERTYQLMREGFSVDQISEILGVKNKASLKIRIQTIKEKVEASE